jgi:hypothetical protein
MPATGAARRPADLIRNRIKIKSLNFMRGRTFLNKFLIIDEAQNLTPKQMKTLITRAGPGTKVICLGNIAQIDTPYLTEGSSGLTYVVDRFQGLAARRPHHPATWRAFAARGLRCGSVIIFWTLTEPCLVTRLSRFWPPIHTAGSER